MRPLLYTLVISTCLQFSIQAQISKGDVLWEGQLRFESFTGFNDITANLTPGMHYFISQKISLGGGVNLGASFGRGIQDILLASEMRYYFNPHHHRANWFIFGSPQLHLNSVDRSNGLSPFQLSIGAGLNLALHKNISLESELQVFFEEKEFTVLHEYPSLFLGGKLVFRLPSQDHWNSTTITPMLRRGTWMIGGSDFQMAQHFQFERDQFRLSVTPRIGLFLSDFFLVGLGIPIEYVNTFIKFDFGFIDESPEKYTAFGVAPFIRLYPGKWQGRFRPYFEFATYFMRIDDKTNLGSTFFQPEIRYRRLLQGSGGLNIFLSPHVALEAGFYLEHNVSQKINRYGLQWGLQYYLGRSQKL